MMRSTLLSTLLIVLALFSSARGVDVPAYDCDWARGDKGILTIGDLEAAEFGLAYEGTSTTCSEQACIIDGKQRPDGAPCTWEVCQTPTGSYYKKHYAMQCPNRGVLQGKHCSHCLSSTCKGGHCVRPSNSDYRDVLRLPECASKAPGDACTLKKKFTSYTGDTVFESQSKCVSSDQPGAAYHGSSTYSCGPRAIGVAYPALNVQGSNTTCPTGVICGDDMKFISCLGKEEGKSCEFSEYHTDCIGGGMGGCTSFVFLSSYTGTCWLANGLLSCKNLQETSSVRQGDITGGAAPKNGAVFFAIVAAAIALLVDDHQ